MNTDASHTSKVTIREALPADREALERLAALDSRRPPRTRVLLAHVGGELVAAIGIETREVVADPFRRTSEVVGLLRLRADQLRATTAVPPARLGPRALRLGLR